MKWNNKTIKLILLDRDGVINFDSPDYILSPEQWHAIPGSLESIARFHKAGVKVAVCSNQSGLGRGMMNQAMFEKIQQKMISQTEAAGGKFDDIAYCPHGPDDECKCRKPKPGMLFDILSRLKVSDTSEVLMIGDSFRDVQAAHAAGVKAMLVSSGYGNAQDIFEKSQMLMPEIQMYANLEAATHALLQED